MVEIVNPQDAVRAVDLDLKLSRIRNKWLRVCGPCDAGLPGTCTHPNEDYRTVIADLITDLEKFRGNAQLLSASTMGEAFDRLEELLAVEKRVARLEKALACPECGAQGTAPCVVKGTDVARSRHMSRIVVEEETDAVEG